MARWRTLMSRPIKAAPCEIQSTGVACPNVIACKLVFGNDPDYATPLGVWVITSVTEQSIIFRMRTRIRSSRLTEVGGQYTYGYDWNTHLVSRASLIEKSRKLFDQVVTNTRHWGKPAQLSLKFLAKTLE